jgi:hypothetical protein
MGQLKVIVLGEEIISVVKAIQLIEKVISGPLPFKIFSSLYHNDH